MTLRLSLCMIAKNEEKFMNDFLSSVKGLVDEIIIVDTGSTDTTVETAKEFGAKVFFREWQDDFSKPRNESLKRATGDWIIYLDPDEKIAPEDFEKLRGLMDEKKDKCYLMQTRNYIYEKKPLLRVYESNDEYAHMGCSIPYYWTSRKVRLFPNIKGVEFRGAVHELVEHSLKELGVKEEESDIPVHHYSQLDKEKSRRKRFFYMTITKKKLQSEPDNAKAYLELGREYFNLRLYHRAIQMYKRGLKLKQAEEDVSSTISYELGVVYLKVGKAKEGEEHLLKAIRLREKNINAANKLLELYTLQKDEKKILWIKMKIGAIVFGLGKYQKVIDHFKPYLSKPLITNFDAYYFSIKAHEALGDKESAEELKKKLSMDGTPILSYHDVGSSDLDWSLGFEEFKNQMLFLKDEGYSFVTLDKVSAKKKSVAVTFDDGRLSFHEIAMPFLKAQGIKTTLFVATDWIEGKNIPQTERYSKFMDWEMITHASEEGHLVCSHTLSHRDLTFLQEADIRKELLGSKKILEKMLGKKIRAISYPFGHYNDDVAKLSEEAGYILGVTEDFGFCRKKNLLMRRIYILKDTSFDTFTRLFSSD